MNRSVSTDEFARLEKIFVLSKIIDEIRSEMIDVNSFLDNLVSNSLSHASLFEEYFPVRRLPLEHVMKLHKSKFHSSFISERCRPRSSIEKDFALWYERVTRSDRNLDKWLDQSSPFELVEYLNERGIYFHRDEIIRIVKERMKLEMQSIGSFYSFDDEKKRVEVERSLVDEWKKVLSAWTRIHRILIEHRIVSLSYLLHLGSFFTLLQENQRTNKNEINVTKKID